MGDKQSDRAAENRARDDVRKERLAGALRDNLKRRKQAQADRAQAQKARKSAERPPPGR